MEWIEDFDVDTLRERHESQAEWDLRKDFIVEYRSQFESARLLCLASAYVNVEVSGCKYPKPLMVQLTQYSASLKGIKAHRDAQKKRFKRIEFVKDEANAKPPPTKMTRVKADIVHYGAS